MDPKAAIDDAIRVHSAGRLAEAEAAYRAILQRHPDHPGALQLLGVALSQQGKKAEAAGLIERAITLAPQVPDFHANLALVYLEMGDPHRAIPPAQRSIQLNPQQAEAHNILGNALKAVGRVTESVACYERALAIRPDHGDAPYNLADALQRLGRPVEADSVLQTAQARNPRDIRAAVARAQSMLRQKRFPEAEAVFRQLLAADPNSADAHDGLATVLMETNRVDDAAALYERAAALDGSHPGPVSNLGFARVTQGRVDEGIACYRRALAIRPDLPDTYNNLGNAYLAKLETAAAMAAYDHALFLKPDHQDAHWNRSLLLLLLGDFARGWPEYEWRWLRFPDQRRVLTQPMWDGFDLTGKTILLHAEQGVGDAIQFVRLAPLVAERSRAAAVMLEVQPELVPVMTKLPGVSRVIPRGEALPPFDTHCPLMSLPHVLRMTAETIPVPGADLATDPRLVERFATIVGRDGLRVGVVWAGAPIHRRDRERSIPLSTLVPLLTATPAARLFSLQKGDPARQLATLPADVRVTDLSGELHDYAHTAAAIANLDLVVSVDTSVAHLSGAMGKPTWTLLPFSPDWRWLLGREDSPWYPTMRLYRQATAGDWAGVVRRVAGDLARLGSR